MHKRLYLSRIFSSILPLVLIHSLPHSGLCALKSLSSIIGAGSCSMRSFISFYVTWSVEDRHIVFFLLSTRLTSRVIVAICRCTEMLSTDPIFLKHCFKSIISFCPKFHKVVWLFFCSGCGLLCGRDQRRIIKIIVISFPALWFSLNGLSPSLFI